ncbi:MAG TPA: leucyl aminopeptidase [Acidimicrobiia bacterium]|nr:leucyl aminopeptidase [Acidimicrobiia bacterium]
MPISATLSSSSPAKVSADVLAVPVFAGRVLGPGGKALDTAVGGMLGAFMAGANFEGKPDETLAVPVGSGALGATAALLVGLGDKKTVSPERLRRAAAAVVRRSSKAQTVATTLLDVVPAGGDRAAAAQAVAEGAALGAYKFLRYKQKSDAPALERLVVLGKKDDAVQRALDRGVAVAGAVAWARDLVNEPAGAMTPTQLAEEARRAAEQGGLEIEILDEVQIANEGLGGLLGVSLGSDQPPRLVKLTYTPPGDPTGTVALVGKGITFDSGGLSLKTAEGMETMKTDMSGAAAVIGAMSVLRDAGVPTKVIGFVPTTENMPGPKAIKPGDVLKIRNGKTVEVLNTDAEGRLILADGLSLAAEEKPDAVIDLATLTGACMVALGAKVAGLMGNDDAWIGQVRDAAARAGELVWHLPLPPEYRKDLDSEIADLKNITGNRYGGALTAGIFLSEFTGDIPWVHLDIAGPARAGSDDGYTPKGGSGFGVRTLVEVLSNFEKPEVSTAKK